MKTVTRIAAIAALTAGLAMSGHSSFAKDGWRISTGVDYSSGDYGTTADTDITYIPITLKYRSGRWGFKATLPYIRVKGPSNVIPDVGQVGTTPTTRKTESGIGDVILSGTYTLVSDSKTKTILDLTGKIKLPTADDKKGLGTGETDYYIQLDAYKIIGKTTPFATLGYKIYGDSNVYKLDNVFYVSLGFSHKLSSSTSTGLILDVRERSTPTGDPRRELTAFMTHKLDSNRKVQAYLVKGFSDGSPDWGVGATISIAF